jgi:hypothetical protein
MRGGRYLVVLAGIGVLATGCGTQTTQEVSVTTAVTQTAAQTARIAITTTMQTQGMSVSFTGTGAFDFAHSRGTITMHNPIGMTELFVPPKTYLKISDGTGSLLPRGKSWFALDDGSLGGPATTSGGTSAYSSTLQIDLQIDPFTGSVNPADLLASLTAISHRVAERGTSTIRGVPVTQYRVTIDPAKAAARVPSWERAGYHAFESSLGPGATPVDVWVDSQNLVRRVQVALHLPGGTGMPAGTTLSETTDFYDFGVPVRVSAPPAAEVADISQFAVAGASSGSMNGGGFYAGKAVGSASPPPQAGTLSGVQAAAAEQAVSAFWTALGRNDLAAVARTVLPAQRSCASSMLSDSPRFTVSSLRIASARPAGNSRATVRFTVHAQASLGGQDIPVFPQGPGGGQWLVTAESGGHWYVDLTSSGGLIFSGACP